MIPDPCTCSACTRLSAALADHALALAFDDPALVVLSRTGVRLAAMVVDVQHGLDGGRQLAIEYNEDAAGGSLLTLANPIEAARAFIRSTAP
jgi:hypothetical protein